MSNAKPEDRAETERLERLVESELLECVADPLVIRPGDTLVVSVSHRLTMLEADEIAETWRRRCPDAGIVIIDGVEQSYVYRPDASDA